MRLKKELFGKMADGRNVWLYTLSNGAGMTVKITNYGGIITSLIVPDRDGKPADVVLGFDSLTPYLAEHPHFGEIVGRCANRIAQATFTLDGVEYQLTANEGGNHLHGGRQNFGRVIWQSEKITAAGRVGVKLSYLAKDGEEGYPGNLKTEVTYWLTAGGELIIEYWAKADRPTIVNLTNHSYFNLSGENGPAVLEHEITINADYFTPADQNLIPTGEILPVKGTALDFTSPRLIGERIGELSLGGYDHNYVLNKENIKLSFAAKATDPQSGRVMEVFTTKPGLQFYTGNSLKGNLRGKSGAVYKKHSAFCLETQYFPNSPNQSNFPTTRLDPADVYRHKTVYKFSTLR